MNEVLYDLYEITGNSSYAELAALFDKACFLGPLALDSDDLDTMHANAHEPIVIGAAKRYELFGDAAFGAAAANFHARLTTDHAYATGNGNHGEYWSVPGRLGDTLDGDTQESCTSYNLLKLDRHLIGFAGAVAYADHYERLFVNGILSTQDSDRIGALIYMLPLSTVNGTSKGWGDPLYSMTCCYGTGIETHAKLADGIFMHQDDAAAAPSGAPTLAVLHFQPSTLRWAWPDAGSTTLTVTQAAEWDDAALAVRVTLAVAVSGGSGSAPSATLQLRVPSWVDAAAGASVAVNGAPVPGSPFAPLSWAAVTRAWALGGGDSLSATLPMAPLRLEAVRDDRPAYANTVAVMVGPWMLVSPSVHGSGLAGDAAAPASWITAVTPAQRAAVVSLTAAGGNAGLVIAHDEAGPGDAFGLSVAAADPTRDSQGPDASFSVLSPGLAGAGTVSIASTNWPSFIVCAARGTAAGAPLVLLDPAARANNASAAACSFAQHAPGLSGAPGSLSFELSAQAGSFLSWSGGGAGGGPLTVQPLKPGDPQFANQTSFSPVAPLWPLPPFSFVAKAAGAARAAGTARDMLLYPIAHVKTETYVSYFQVGM